jgi:hypothetical protein
MDFELFDSTLSVRGETQIRTVGLRVSSYATNSDGIPAMTASSRHALLSALQAKAAFDGGLRVINENASVTQQTSPIPEPHPSPIVQETPRTPVSSGVMPSEIPSHGDERRTSHTDAVTILSALPRADGRTRRRKYANRADQQRAYRERKATLHHESTV